MKYFAITDDTELRIYFRIPFTEYFLGKFRYKNQWTKLYLFTMEWDGVDWAWVRVTGLDLPK